jgi:hypothetical protein
MDDARLPTSLWVMAVVRRCNAEGRPVMVVRRGEPSGGLVLLKLNRLDGTLEVLTQQREPDSGALGWFTALGGKPAPEAEAEAYIARALKRDPDLWVIEVEDRRGENPFPGRRFS